MALAFSSTRRPPWRQVHALYRNAAWASKRKPEAIRRLIRGSDLFFSAWDGPLLVGMARVSSDFAARAVLWDVIVAPAYARKGVGTRLVSLALRHPRLKRVESFWLFTTDKQAFYRRLGFKAYPRHVMVRR